MRLGIRGLLGLGLAGLLSVAGVIAGLVLVHLVAREAEEAVLVQQRSRAAAVAAQVAQACAGALSCPEALEAAVASARSGDLVELALVGSQLRVLAGRVEPGALHSGTLADALQGRRTSWATVEREPSHPRGEGADQRVVVPMRLASDGRRAVLVFGFELDGLRSALGARLRVVLLYLVFDFVTVLLFGIYLGGRYIVRPLRELTLASERIAAGALQAGTVPAIGGAAELAQLGRAFADMVARLAQQRAELQGSLQKLQAAQDDLLESARLATVGELAAGIAHEVGNPLAAVIGYVEYLREEPGAEEALREELLGRMETELNRIRDTTRQLLDLSRPAPHRPERVDLRELVPSVAAFARYQKKMKRLELAVQVHQEAPLIWADPSRLRQVLLNLMLNAADAVGGRGEVVVRLRPWEGGARVDVRDDGPGVPKGEREALFEPFFTTKPAGQGTGLGLAICKRFVEEDGGRIWLDGGEPSGACFAIWWPAAEG